MAKEHIISITDDIDGSPASTTVEFSLDGKSYSIDLNDGHVGHLHGIYEPYIEAGRRTSGRSQARGSRSAAQDGANAKTVRAWAQSQGIPMNPRGRISSDVMVQFRAAGN